MVYTSADLASLVTWVSILTGIGGLITGSISLTITLREKRRSIKVVLNWGVDPTYQKTSGIVLLIAAANSGYQPVVIQSAGLHIVGVTDPLIAAKPHVQSLFPMKLEPGDQFSTSISSEVLIQALRRSIPQGKSIVRGFVQTVFGEYHSAKVEIDVKQLETLVALVQNNASYKLLKDSLLPMGSVGLKSFPEVEHWVESISKGDVSANDIAEK